MNSISSFFDIIYIIVIAIAFYTKNRVNSRETKLFSMFIVVTFLELLTVIISYFTKDFVDVYGFYYLFLNKLTIAFHILWPSLFTLYVFTISKNGKEGSTKQKNNKVLIIVCFVLTFLSFFLKMNFIEEDNMYIPSGPAVTYVYFVVITSIIIMIILLFLDIKNIKSKQYIPLYAFLLLSSVATVIQMINPHLLLSTSVHAIIVLLMYITLENPDMRIAELEKKNAELAEAANEAKTAFLSSMSHELRTPLNAIVGLSEDIMSYQDKVPSEVREDSIDIVNASNTLLELIGNILDISKIEGGKLEIIEADYLPKEEIESLLKIMRTKVEEKDLAFNIFIDPNIPECLYGDRLRIKQIINNFLSNAVKYTEKGSVNFGVRWIDNSLQIRVSDTGRGIKKEDMDKLFEKFERLHVEKTSSVQGTGLGLAITKNLVNLMGGRIVVDSVYGKGSTFDVYIPQKLGNKDNIVREALSVEEKHVSDYTGKKVLVVDDNKLNIKVLRKAIAAFNFEIDECYDGKQALEKIGANNYDLILMDIMMPVMGGEEAMGLLKQNPQFNTPVIALTADATTGAKERYMAMGFSDYLAKPFSRDIIANKLDNVLGNTK